MSPDNLLRGTGGGLLPTPPAKREIDLVYELLEGVYRPHCPSHAAVDLSEHRGEHAFCLRFGHLGLSAERFASSLTVLPVEGNPHPMLPVLPGLQAAPL